MKGRILAGKYRLVAELGRGGMGSVWRADHIELRSVVAVKLIDPALAHSAEGRSRFLREARAAGALRSNHVVQVYDYGVDEGVPFLVMELLEGESLASRLERKLTLTLAEMQPILRQVGRALAKAHAAGIVHRDLKPENIFICTEGDSELVKVLDFGIAKVESNIAASVQTQTGLVLGTPYYMSPEQAEGRKALDLRSDLWSLGVIAYECLLGKRPFDGDNLAQLILAICAMDPPLPSQHGIVPAGFDAWFLKAVARPVEQRFANIQELVDAFAALGQHQGVESTVGVIAHNHAPERLSAPSDSFLKEEAGVASSTAFVPVADPPRAASEGDFHADPVGPAQAVNPVGVSEPGVTTPGGPSPLLQGTTDGLSTTNERSGRKGPPLGLIVGALALLFVVGAVAVWRSGQRAQSAAAPADTQVIGEAERAKAAPDWADPGESEASAAAKHVAPPPSGSNAIELSKSDEPENGADTVSTNVEPALTDSVTSGPAPAATPEAASSRDTALVTFPKPQPSPAPNLPRVDKPPPAPALYCVVNAISGRLQRAPAGTPGSFPCYVHAISGQLKRKN